MIEGGPQSKVERSGAEWVELREQATAEAETLMQSYLPDEYESLPPTERIQARLKARREALESIDTSDNSNRYIVEALAEQQKYDEGRSQLQPLLEEIDARKKAEATVEEARIKAEIADESVRRAEAEDEEVA